MTDKRLKEIKKDSAGKQVLSFIPNNLGINLSEVKDIEINRVCGELTDITIKFKIHCDDTDSSFASA